MFDQVHACLVSIGANILASPRSTVNAAAATRDRLRLARELD